MKPPFTLAQFLEVFRSYNEAVFPMQLILYILSIIVIYLTLKPHPVSSKITSGIMVFLWLWMGIVYHIIFFTAINKAAYLFGGLFIIQSILFMILGVFQNKFSFQFQNDIYGIIGFIWIVFALVIYPVLGYFLGHVYPSSPTFGLPCPTAIFTFGMILLNTKRCPIAILIIPCVWSLIGFTAVFQFGMLEDTALILVSLITTILLIYRNRAMSIKMLSEKS